MSSNSVNERPGEPNSGRFAREEEDPGNFPTEPYDPPDGGGGTGGGELPGKEIKEDYLYPPEDGE